MKKLLALLLAAVMILSLAACAAKTESTTQKDASAATSTSDNAESASQATTDNSDDEVITLRLMAYNAESTRATYLQYVAEMLPNIEIQFEFVPTDNMDTVLTSQLQAGEGPDIIEVGGDTKLLAKAGYLLDLTDQSFLDGYADSGIQPYTVDGKVYAAPLQSWFEGIFYNKAIFRENNIEIPKTWDEFIAIHKTLTDAGYVAQTMGAQNYVTLFKSSVGAANNVFYSDPANKSFDESFNTGEGKLEEAWLPALEMWYGLIENGCLTEDMLGLSLEQALNDFASGKAAMMESGPWDVGTILEKNPDIELGMFPFPGTDADEPGWLVGGPGSAFAINAASENVEAALQVLALTATAEAQVALIKDNAGSSFVKGVDVDLGDIYTDCADAFAAGNVYAPWTAVWTNGNAMVEALGKSLQEVLSGTKTVQQALADADAANLDLLETLG